MTRNESTVRDTTDVERNDTGNSEGHERIGVWWLPRELWRRNAVLSVIAGIHVVLLGVFLVGLVTDPRTIGGEPVWLKPAKFAGSIGLVTGTIVWLSTHLPVSETTLRRASIGIALTAVIEITLISGQAARGVESHFNYSTPFNVAIYSIMGVTILGFTLLVTWVFISSLRGQFSVEPAFRWGIVSGLAVFILGSIEGVRSSRSGGVSSPPGPHSQSLDGVSVAISASRTSSDYTHYRRSR